MYNAIDIFFILFKKTIADLSIASISFIFLG